MQSSKHCNQDAHRIGWAHSQNERRNEGYIKWNKGKYTGNHKWREGNQDSSQWFGTKRRNKDPIETEWRIKNSKKNEERLRNIWDNFTHSNVWITGVPKGEEWCGLWPAVSMVLWMRWTNSCGLQQSCGEKGQHGHSLREGMRARQSPQKAQPLPGQAFIAFLGTLHWGWSSFNMHRFTVGDCLLQTTKDRMLLITSKRRMLQIKGESGWTGYTPYLGGLAQTLGS